MKTDSPPPNRVDQNHIAQEHVANVRRFNRFYTRQIGVLRKNFLDSPYSLGEMRVLYELAQGNEPTASDIARELDLDAGYLSRVLRDFEKKGLVSRTTSKIDARQSHLSLTAKGRKVFAPADKRSQDDVAAMLARLDGGQQTQLVTAMQTIESLLEGEGTPARQSLTLRAPRHGDFGWIVSEHARVYTSEYGWDNTFEGLVAQIVSDFVKNFDPAMESCWIAEIDGENVGSVMLVKDEKPGTARIRLLIVSPKARGLGLGARLTDECIAFARAKGYRAITLWTHDCLKAARHCYEKAGFLLTSRENRMSFGQNVVAEFWDMAL
jgi:DNA-binding MarR family transcriptional regulator/GNAT superfamily N-acetyltransferase